MRSWAILLLVAVLVFMVVVWVAGWAVCTLAGLLLDRHCSGPLDVLLVGLAVMIVVGLFKGLVTVKIREG